MKRTFFLCMALLLLLPTAAMAHSKLETAVPGIDSTVDASPEKIELTYNTRIEKLSTMQLFNESGDTVETGEVTVDGDTLSAALLNPLPNGAYTVKWTIIGADTHVIEGEYAFHVDAPVVEPTATESPEEADADENGEQSAEVEPAPTPAETQTPVEEAESDSNEKSDGMGWTPFIVIGALIIAVAVILVVRRRKP